MREVTLKGSAKKAFMDSRMDHTIVSRKVLAISRAALKTGQDVVIFAPYGRVILHIIKRA